MTNKNRRFINLILTQDPVENGWLPCNVVSSHHSVWEFKLNVDSFIKCLWNKDQCRVSDNSWEHKINKTQFLLSSNLLSCGENRPINKYLLPVMCHT
jgi:hypothetical protein